MAPLMAGATDGYLPAVGPVSLSHSPPPPPLSPLAWRLPLPSACIDVNAEKRKTDSTAHATPVSPGAAKTPSSASDITNPRATAANASATGVGGTPSSSAFATANQGEAGIRSQSLPPVPPPAPPVGGNDSQATAFALMQYFQPGHARKGTTDVIVPVPVGFVPPTPARTTPSSSATYLSP